MRHPHRECGAVRIGGCRARHRWGGDLAGPATSYGGQTDGDDSDDGAGPKLDVSSPAFDLGDCPEGCLGCNAVDILFVIDNSEPMADYQAALVDAFGSFATALFEGLPANTSVHVGITSTTMGESAVGMTDGCTATGDGMQPVEAFYTTPDEDDTGIPGAQGRLYVADDQAYFQGSTFDDPEPLIAWFTAGALIGESGSQVEMSGAAAAWATDPVNDETNMGFIRDEGAVLVVFVIQDEPDQSPMAEADALVEKLAAAKATCGGMQCIVAGGFVQTECLPENPLGAIFEAAGASVVHQLPSFNAATTSQTFEQVLRDTLADVVVQTCSTTNAG